MARTYDYTSGPPQTYAQWRECITVHCGIPLELGYVVARVGVLGDDEHPETQRFIRTHGLEHRDRVLAWFKRARGELEGWL
ncbi:hypothetical protein ACVU7I_01630 [Patulibacter sp. S7RM1-6]